MSGSEQCSNCGESLTSGLQREYGLCTDCAAKPVDEVPHAEDETDGAELTDFEEGDRDV